MKSKAFTLIELLVVIAIIAILAAILFPVFAQAKAAAKQTVALSNQKQIGTSLQLYMGDNDDLKPMRYNNITPTLQYSWKQNLNPYSKSVDLFRDSMNVAAKYYDDFSDKAYRDLYAMETPPQNLRYPRGYAMTNLFYLTGKWDDAGFTPTSQENPANLLATVETKRSWVDMGANNNWEKNWTEPDGQKLNLGWNWGGNKKDDKVMVVSFFDGHAKLVNHGAVCGKASEVNMWGYQRDKLATNGAYIPGATLEWLDAYCSTRPTGY